MYIIIAFLRGDCKLFSGSVRCSSRMGLHSGARFFECHVSQSPLSTVTNSHEQKPLRRSGGEPEPLAISRLSPGTHGIPERGKNKLSRSQEMTVLLHLVKGERQ